MRSLIFAALAVFGFASPALAAFGIVRMSAPAPIRGQDTLPRSLIFLLP